MEKKIKTERSYLVKLPFKAEKDRGNLYFGETEKQIPFQVKRFYYISDVPFGVNRGGHAHKNCKQILFCVKGSVKLKIDDGVNKDEIILSRPDEGIFLGEKLWVEIADFQKEAILLVFASDFHKEEDYIRDYQDFKRYVK